MRIVTLGLVFVAAGLTPAQSQGVASGGTRVLTVTYADGFVTSHVLAGNAAPFLAPGFAPTAGPRLRPEVPVTWLRLSPRAARDRVDVQIESFGLGRSSNRTTVGSVSVAAEPATLPAFAAVGIQAMTFSIGQMTAPAEGTGRGLSSVRGVDLVDEPGQPGSPWRVEIQNRSGKPIRSARVITFAGGRVGRIVAKRGRDGAELMDPMEGYRPDLGSWAPHDFAIVTAVTWTDGTMAGDVADGIDELMLDAAERLHAMRVTGAIRVALASPFDSDPIAALKSALAAQPVPANDAEFQAGEARLPFADLMPADQLRQMMDGVLKIRRQEFDREIAARLASRASGAPPRTDADLQWLQRTLSRYDAWGAALKR